MLDDLLRLSEQTYVSPSLIGFSYVDLGDKEKGFAWLEKAYDERDFFLIYLRIDPRRAGLRADPRFMALMQKMGLGT